jgi:hypothetical protein
MIHVQLRQLTPGGALYPRYVEDAGILAVESRVARDWPYGIDIDGLIVFDIDADRVLANFDLHIAKRYWKVAPPERRPRPARTASLEFARDSIEHKSFHLPLRVRTDATRSFALIEIGDLRSEGVWAALSEYCMVRVDSDCLTGLFVVLKPPATEPQ